MGKAKKGKKGPKDDETDEEIELESTSGGGEENVAGITLDKKVKSKVKVDDEGDEEVTSKKKKGKKERKKKAMDSDDSATEDVEQIPTVKGKEQTITVADDEPLSEPDFEEKKTVVKDVNGDSKPAVKKGKKSKKKKDESDDDDIEQMLAELALEYSGGKKEEIVETREEEKVEVVKKVKTKGKESIITDSIEVKEEEEVEGSTVKSAAQKKKEKKERERLKKQAEKKLESVTVKPEETVIDKPVQTIEKKPVEISEDKPVIASEETPEVTDEKSAVDGDGKKKKKKGAEEEKKEKAKGPNKKLVAAMQEALRKVKEEEERLEREEEERIRRLEEQDAAKLEAARIDQARRDHKKMKDRERKERLKSEGKLLTAKQKLDRARAQAMLEGLKAQGVDVPTVGERKAPKPMTRLRGKTPKIQIPDEVKVEVVDLVVKEEIVEKVEVEEDGGVKDAWDAESSEEEEEEEVVEDVKEEEEVKEEKDEQESEGSSEDESEEDDHKVTDAERKREKALARIRRRREDAEAGKSLDNLRAAVVCVLGHVDTGKTKILDKLRRTNVQDGEAGGITQQIGATNVPLENIREQTRIVRGFADFEMKIPGLLIIDTPGHESFSNLRSRGSSLCDIAILVVDIMHGIEPQTLESINLLKAKKTPFVVALNKIDRLYDWQTMARKDVRDVLKAQAGNTQLEFEQRVKEVVVQFAEQGLNASLFYENPDQKSYVSLVPTSAITGEGISNLLALIVEYCQSMLARRLMYSDELQATVLEVKAIPGLGTTIDAILINGRLREGDTMILAGTDGPIVTQIRSLLMPQPMKELRVKNAYVEYKEIKAAQGVKLAARDLEKAIAGLNLLVAQKPDEVDLLREEVAKELRHALSNIKLQDRGVYVQASTLGSLEALLEFLKASKIPYSNIRIGPVVKKDVMKASAMLEHDSQYAVILAFDVKIEKDAQDMADTTGVKIFQADIIYHLFDKFIAYRDELKQRKRDEFKHVAVFPCKLKILPQFIFNSRDPIVMGVMVEAGIVREGTPICVPSREFVEIGVIRSIENNKKNVETARKGQEVCIKIEAIPGEAPKMFGRHFDENDMLVSKISRQSIDACKDYFRDDLVKADWELMVQLKKQFEIL